MRIRIKFSKTGVMKFISHLDVLRYFQKALRRAGVDVAYSGGFSPHQIMSFASPLGLGLCSCGEYMDIEVNGSPSGTQLLERLNAVMVPGMEILSVRALPETAGNAMASVTAARYIIAWPEESGPNFDLNSQAKAFMEQEQLPFLKETKKGTTEVDLRPGIYELAVRDGKLELLLNASSGGSLRPQLVLAALYHFAGADFPASPAAFHITRMETYAAAGGTEEMRFVPLEEMGVDF